MAVHHANVRGNCNSSESIRPTTIDIHFCRNSRFLSYSSAPSVCGLLLVHGTARQTLVNALLDEGVIWTAGMDCDSGDFSKVS
jgi:hypothetical protein